MNGKVTKILAVIAVLIIILAGIAALMLLREKEEIPTEEKEEFVLDDRISPYENQGLFVEILRIRNRDLLNRMMKFGMSWRETPSFYYTIDVDGKVGSNKGHAGENEVYETWDTFGRESMISFYIEEEKPISKVNIKIIEVVKRGLFGRRTSEVEKESFTVTYDYRTGRWYGDDYFNDKDGYGYYLGENYEVWFNIYQADYDNDGIPYWTEVNVLGTDPTVDDSKLDPDNDGIPTDWEWRWGYDPFVWNDHAHLDPDIDGLTNIEEYKIRKWLANPFQPDIYIEVDHTEKTKLFDLDHVFYKESQQMLIERFAQHGIKVFIDDGWADGPLNGGGEILPDVAFLDDVSGKQILQYYTHHFADERKGIFRYMIVSGYDGGFICPVNFNRLDAICIGNNLRSALLVRFAFSPRTVRIVLAAAVMHELGHSLGLVPVAFPGIDIVTRSYANRYPNMSDEDYKGYLNNYRSIMNYKYIYNKKLFDYSNGSNGPPYDQNDWEHIYLPFFKVDMPSYEEPADETFEDFEVVNEYPGVIVKGWEYSENLTKEYSQRLKTLALVKNTDADIQIFVKNDSNDSGYNIRVYAKPNVEPVYAVYSLVAEGYIDNESNIKFYSQEDLVKYAKSFIKK